MSSNSSIDVAHSHEHQLPNEIIDEVVDHLQDNNEALKAISLSSRNFLHRARKHLFATFVLQAPSRKDTPISSLPSRKIFHLIKSAPHLIPYIQVLEITCPGKTTWLKFDKQFSKALGLFQQTLETESATFSLRHLYLNNITWSHLSIDSQAAIQRLLGFRPLEEVTFYRTSFVPWTVFKDISPNVTALALESALFWPEVESEDSEDSETDDEWYEDDIGPLRDSTQALSIKESGLDRLCIGVLHIARGALGEDPTIIFAHNSVCPINVTHLHTFWVHVRSDYQWIRHQEFISHVGCSLETLEINFSSFTDETLPLLDCQKLGNLKHLHVQTSYRSNPFALQSAFFWLGDSLETLPRQHKWQTIGIRCVIGVIECVDYQSKWPKIKKDLRWELIDWFLTQPMFDSLRQIRVRLVLSPPGVNWSKYSAILRAAPVLLPRVMAKGIVVLDSHEKEVRLPP